MQESNQLPIHWKRQRQVFLIILHGKEKKTVSHFMINENGSFNWYAPYIGVVSRRLDPQVLKRSLTVVVV